MKYMVNLNKFAQKVAKGEGLLESISIAQVKEVLRVIGTELAKLPRSEQHAIIDRYKQVKKAKKN